MQFQRLTNEQKRIRQWRLRRNALIGKLLAENPHLLRAEALTIANRTLRHSAKGMARGSNR